ncbi:MAG: M1 family metallopeptidase [Spirosomataceae bacterium]
MIKGFTQQIQAKDRNAPIIRPSAIYLFPFLLVTILSLCSTFEINAQYTRQDSLRGTLSEIRSCYDVTFYDLYVKVHPAQQLIEGHNTIYYKAVKSFNRLQVDLFANMEVLRISQNGKSLLFSREGNAIFVDFPQKQEQGINASIRIDYRGNPKIAVNPPWDGGFSWKKDANNKDWVTVSCEGIGASLWWPNKDHLSDEPDSMRITSAVPNGLMSVSNGNLRSTLQCNTYSKKKKKQQALSANGYTEFEWFVSYPINNYDVTLNIADYAHIQDVYLSKDTKKKLALDYYVLKNNAEKAKVHFQQVKPMLAIYEKYFGTYPFWNDGYALVETPYWGMEHQGAVAYGNNYKNNPYGFDFIIIHESGHEYFGNSLSCNDHAEMWIHESFTTYMEAIYLESLKGYPTSVEYLIGQKKRIQNKAPMIGPMGVNYDGPDSDIYFKGTWMLHTIRNIIDNDTKWFDALKGLTTTFARQNVTSEQVINYFSQKTGMNLNPYFDLYLRSTIIPSLEYKLQKQGEELRVQYRWSNTPAGFSMPIVVQVGNDYKKRITPTNEWQEVTLPALENQAFKVDTSSFLIESKEVKE